jgi:hypothetical protein
MQWMWVIAALLGGVGCWLGWRRGVEEGAQAALNIQEGLYPGLLIFDGDRSRIQAIFRNTRWHDVKDIKRATIAAGEAYQAIIRRWAIEDCRSDSITEADRVHWKEVFGKDMPDVSYNQGYLQAIKDVLQGVNVGARKYFEESAAVELCDSVDTSQRKFIGPPFGSGMYHDTYDPDGKELGLVLITHTVMHAFMRAEKERNADQ